MIDDDDDDDNGDDDDDDDVDVMMMMMMMMILVMIYIYIYTYMYRGLFEHVKTKTKLHVLSPFSVSLFGGIPPCSDPATLKRINFEWKLVFQTR